MDNLCNFSRNSGLCICIVTWNMNGHSHLVSYEDLVKLIGLQEVPRDNVAGLLQDALVETHDLLGKAIMQSLQLYVFGPKKSDLLIKDFKVDEHSVEGFGERKGAWQSVSVTKVSEWFSSLAIYLLLASKDQLHQEANRGQIFNGYCEGTLTFKPTYEYNIGSSKYDTSHKVRVPSWTDRILFKSASLHCYESVDGIYSSDHKPDPPFDTPSGSGDAWREHENEEIDRAIALSLLEGSQKERKVKDDEYQLKEDEQLARALQESLKFEPPPQYENQNTYQPPPVHFPTGYRICAGCNTEIGYGRFLNCLSAFWHPECFRCHACNLPISDYEYHPKCEVCNHFIPTNPAGLIEYRAHPFWNQKYCPSHEHDGTPRCCSCERMEPQNTGYVALNDGRKLCLECLGSAVMDTRDCQPIYQDIQEFYEGLNMKVEQQVPLLLVERQALNDAREGEKNGHYHMPETRGLCLSEEQTISTILRRPRSGTGNRTMNMITEPYKLTRRCDVTAILILFGLPRLLTGSILAHEMMHAWMRLQGFRTLSQDVEEGICQVLAHMWLYTQLESASSNAPQTSSSASSSRLKKGKRSQLERKLGEFFKHQIESDASPVYGDGFRAGHQAVYKYGLSRTLEHIRMTGRFPN
ncbi:hypothetical protein V6N11_030310 [Hibiscus sabdariffa]|uniref:LIM zinc-binding domain-containing protein n=1 Tax=Hibiscus sabdariffa TaxID=183260 RepID=A0ABR2PKW2_9ROSI